MQRESAWYGFCAEKIKAYDHPERYTLPTTRRKVMVKRFSHKLPWELDDQEDQGVVAGPEEVAGGSGGSGGWMWAPRSYSCSFCKREFRSAQALGGHMNVHRRDRALLKQVVSHSIIDHNHTLPSRPSDRHHDLDLRSPAKSMASPYPSQQLHPRSSVLHLSSSRVSSSYYSHSDVISGLKKVITANDVAQVKMSMGLDFSTGRYRKEEDEEEEEEKLSSKRCKKSGKDDGVVLLPFFDEVKYLNVKVNPELQAAKSVEGLDLELRLGLVSHAF